MAVPGALLFADRSAKAFRHLYTDVLRAVAGDWCADPVVLRFDWPIPGVNGSPAEALGAFVDKQIGDFEARRVLVLAELAPLFGRLDRSFESIAGGDTLDDPVVKSELWQRIRTAQGGRLRRVLRLHGTARRRDHGTALRQGTARRRSGGRPDPA
jgi:hypothetical protein